MALKDFASPTEWAADLDRRFPERRVMQDAVLDRAAGHAERAGATARVLELGCGTGTLLLALAERLPGARLSAIDHAPALLELVRRRSHRAGVAGRLTLVSADLSAAVWPPLADAPFDTVFTVQTLHDLGGRDTLAQVYRNALSLLAPGGLLVSADFHTPFAIDDPAEPRRFPAAEHCRLLDAIGYVEPRHVATEGALACVVAYAPNR